MPILAVAAAPADLMPTLHSAGRRTLSQVSAQVRDEIEQMMSSDDRCCEPHHVERLRELAQSREADAELMLLVRVIDAQGRVCLRFL